MSGFEKFEFSLITLPLFCLLFGYIGRLMFDNEALKSKSTTENVFYNFIVGAIACGIMLLTNYIGCSSNIPMK
ncbi:hypothetical protein CXF59_01695 [Flavobacterium sp. ALD4]|nr:hypothetical protein CXF59_01695 [Flavobacterium sp. ALD4]